MSAEGNALRYDTLQSSAEGAIMPFSINNQLSTINYGREVRPRSVFVSFVPFCLNALVSMKRFTVP